MSDSGGDQNFGEFEDDSGDIRPIDISGGGAGGGQPHRAADISTRGLRERGLPQPGSNELLVSSEEEARNIVKKGDYVDMLGLVPSLHEVVIGTGWEMKSVETDKIDVDLSCFLMDKTSQTRVDEDFVFYNHPMTLEGAVKHMGDSRGGDGDGDDEQVFLDLNGVPFDIVRIPLVLSIYDEEIRGWHFGMVKDLFLRLVDNAEGHEILRVSLNENDFRGQTAILVGTIVREGPKWFFEVSETPSDGGLASFAKKYGIIVREDTG